MTALVFGDVLLNSFGGGREYTVIGFTARGKVRYRRETGGTDSAWWSSREDLPKRTKWIRNDNRIIEGGCGCASNPALEICTPCDRTSHLAGWPRYRMVTREQLERLTQEAR